MICKKSPEFRGTIFVHVIRIAGLSVQWSSVDSIGGGKNAHTAWCKHSRQFHDKSRPVLQVLNRFKRSDRIKSIITKGQTTTVGNDDTSVQPGYFPRGGQ